jgi:hypothetical protein
MPKFELVQFYYSTKVAPGDKFPCDNGNALKLMEELKAKGYNTEAVDVETIPDIFRIYHKATTGPDFAKRAAFGGERGADYNEFFGKTIPALLCWTDAASRGPTDVYPRMDSELERIVGIEEALQQILAD